MLASRARTFVAAALTALVPPLALAARNWPFEGDELLTLMVPSLFVSSLAMFLIGLPLANLLRARGWLNLPVLALAGTVVGIVVFVVVGWALGAYLGVPYQVGILKVRWAAALGMCMGVVFGLVAGVAKRGA